MQGRALLAAVAAVVVTTAGSGYLGRSIGGYVLDQVARQERREPTTQTRSFVRDMAMDIGIWVGGFAALTGLGIGVGVWKLLGRHTEYVMVSREQHDLYERWCESLSSGDIVSQVAIEDQLRKEGHRARTR